jgi:CBS domain-containing protein
MARSVEEVMNRELLAVVPETPVEAIRDLMRTFEISAVPVVDDERRPIGMVAVGAVLDGNGTAGDRMSRPAPCVDASTDIQAAARRLAATDAHHLVVVDGAGVAAGIVSVMDVMRAMLGLPVHHPAAFPHWDSTTQSSWTDDRPLDDEHASEAPDAAGVLVLVRSAAGETDVIVWAEACANVRDRVVTMTRRGVSDEPASLARLLERPDLRFRAAAIPGDADRERVALGMRSDLEHRPPPGAT